MTQEAATDSRPEPRPAFWDRHFNDPVIGAFLNEAVSELVDEIGGPGRGISWAITILGSGETPPSPRAARRRAPRMRRNVPSTMGLHAQWFEAGSMYSLETRPWTAAGPDMPVPPLPSESGPSYPYRWSPQRCSVLP